MKICIFGNSVAFRMRPPRRDASERTYCEWLQADGHDVRVVAGAGVLLNEAFATLDDDVVTAFPDVVIINYGIGEVCYRQTVRWINNRTITNYYLNQVFARDFEFDTAGGRSLQWFWRGANGLVRRVSRLLRLRWQWLRQEKFLEALDATIGHIVKETGAHVIVLGINPCSPRVERVLAGSADAIAAANEGMKAVAARYGGRASFLSVAECLSARLDDLVPDGIHLSAGGHRSVADALRARLGALPQLD